MLRLVERLGRALVRLGQRFGEIFTGGPRPPRESASPASAPANGNGTGGGTSLIHLTLTPGQVPALLLLLLANIAIIIVATLLVARALGSAAAPLSAQSLGTEVAQNVPQINVAVSPPPAGPTPTAPPNPLSLGGTIFYAYRNAGRTNLWAQVLGRPGPVRLTAGPWDDRDPAASPDGTRLAFASRREGTWNIYLLDLRTGDVRRLTAGPEYKADPHWSPDGQWLVFEWYRSNNFDLALVNANGGDLIALTSNPAADYEPAWSPNGRQIVWVSMRSGNPDLWTLSLDSPDEKDYRPLTNSPNVQEADPAFSPNGETIVYGDTASPLGLVYRHSTADPNDTALEVGQGQHPMWSPDGSSLLSLAPQENGQSYLLAAPFGQPGLAQIAAKITLGHVDSMAWSPVILPETLAGSMAQAALVSDAPLWNENLTAPQAGDPPYALVPLPGRVSAPDPRLADRVDEAFTGLRNVTAQAVGWDFLASLDNAVVPVKAPLPPSLDFESWLRTGRAFNFTRAAAQAGWVEVTREDIGFRTYWRVWVRARIQDGTLGEPLRNPPWNFDARFSKRPQPYDAGGEYYSVMPPGYFVDFTSLAEDFGWTRVPAEANWPSYYPGILYWRFEHRDGLSWLTAMREIYSEAAMATPTLVPSPTNTPTPSNTPTRTATPTRRPTGTPIPSRTPRPSATPSPSRTPTITKTPSPTLTPSLTPTPTGTWYTATPTATETPTITPTPRVLPGEGD